MATLAGTYLNSSISQLHSPNPCQMLGIFVSSATGATIAVSDSNASLTFTPVVVASFTPLAGSWYPMPFQMKNGLNVSIAGTVTYTTAF